jgi:hypothetical protein
MRGHPCSCLTLSTPQVLVLMPFWLKFKFQRIARRQIRQVMVDEVKRLDSELQRLPLRHHEVLEQ